METIFNPYASGFNAWPCCPLNITHELRAVFEKNVIVFALGTTALDKTILNMMFCNLDARFQNPPLGGFKHVECLCGTPGIVSLLKTWFFQLCMIASTLFWSNSMDTFNGLIVLRIHF